MAASKESALYSVHIVKGIGLPVTAKNEAPKAYVKVQINDKSMRTRAKERNRDPLWDEQLQFSAAKDLSAIFTLQVKHDARVWRDTVLGAIEMDLRTLIDLTKKSPGDLNLKMKNPIGKDDNKDRGAVVLRFIFGAPEKVGGEAVDFARSVTATSGISKASQMSDAISPEGVAVDLLANPPNWISALGDVVSQLDSFVKIVDEVAKIHPFANIAWTITSSLYHAVKGQLDRDERMVELLESMRESYEFVDTLKDFPKKLEVLENTIMTIIKQTVECTIFIREYSGHGFGGRLIRQTLSTDSVTIDKFTKRFQDLKRSLSTSVSLQTAFVSIRLAEGVDRLVRVQDLQNLHPAHMDTSDRPECQPDTRLDSLQSITDWLMSPSENYNVFWLYGIAGCGKSTLATTIANYFRLLGRLGAFMFFNRSAESEPKYFVRTLAYQLGTFDPRIGNAISAAIASNPRIDESPLRLQFTNLILEPLLSLQEELNKGPIVIVVDALDECAIPGSRKALLRLLAEELKALPAFVRFFITSRPEHDLVSAFKGKGNFYPREFQIDGESNMRDVTSYLRHQLVDIRVMNDELELAPDWPGEDAITALSQRSAGLFVWCSTAMGFIEKGQDPEERLGILLRSDFRRKAEQALDDLYVVALQNSGLWEDDTFGNDFRAIIGLIIVSKEPLWHDTINGLLGLESRKPARHTIQRFGCVLRWVSPEPVRILHPSFADFLSDRNRCKRDEWFIDVELHNRDLTRRCLQVMKAELKFNICGLDTSHVFNKEVKDLETRIKDSISSHLSYACRFWATHLRSTSIESPGLEILRELINDFLHVRFLYWLEVLSLIQSSTVGPSSMLSLVNWTKECDEQLAAFSIDARKFSIAFQTLISESAPHIYISAIPFSPSGSKVSQQYLRDYSNTLTVPIGKAPAWPAILNVFEGHRDVVTSVAFSQGGKHILSGSRDMTIRIWNAETTALVTGPFKGHTSRVTCVAFSPEVRLIASSSGDYTIRVWNGSTGELVAGPFKGHTDIVTTVAFSPDGKSIVSGSMDKTLRIWSTLSGEMLTGPIVGHDGRVNSATFSPKGNSVVSGSADKTIRIWDVTTGKLVSGPFKGHDGVITCISISPDGMRIASSSYDNTVRIWDSETGKVLFGPFKGHRSVVTSVAFSPDGHSVVSGSQDKTVQLWEFEKGDKAWSLKGHDDWVTSVCFSPDGKRIASAAEDDTIRVWDTEAERTSFENPAGHEDFIEAVRYSRDGKRLVSGGEDRTLRVWNPDSGSLISGPFKLYDSPIKAVDFSPDGKQIVVGFWDGSIRVCDSVTGELHPGQYKHHHRAVLSVRFSPEGKRVVSGSCDLTIVVWDVGTGNIKAGPFLHHTESVTGVEFSPDGKYVTASAQDSELSLWDSETGELIWVVLRGDWDPETFEPLPTGTGGHVKGALAVTFSPDGKRIASASFDTMVIIWDVSTGRKALGPLKGHTSWVNTVAFSPNGKYLVSGSLDNTVRIWDATTGEPLFHTFEGHGGRVTEVQFSPDGNSIVSCSDDATIRVWGPFDWEDTKFDAHAISSERKPVDPTTEIMDVSTLVKGGWMRGTKSELLFWAPPDNRIGLWRRNTAVIGRHTTKLDLATFVHGTAWGRCRVVDE